MTASKGIPITNAAPTPLDGRKAQMGEVVCNADGTPRTGILGYFPAILTPLGTMNVAVAACEFVQSKSKADGVVIFTNDGTVNVPITAPGSNSHWITIYAKQSDSTTGDGVSTATITSVTGTAAASPTEAAVPTGGVRLGAIRVYAGTVAANGGSNVTVSDGQMTAMRGGVVPFRTVAERNLWTTAQDGQMAYCADVDASFVWASVALGWVHAFGKPLFSAVTFGTFGGVVYSAGALTPRVVEQGGMIRLEGGVASSSAAFVLGTPYQIGTIPSAKAPVATRRFALGSNSTALAILTITSAGDMTIQLNTSFGPAPLDLSLDGCEWPDKRFG